MTKRETLEYIEYLNTFGASLGLDTIRELCRRLHDPQKESVFIHVAGTNGKGSVSAMMESVLTEAGFRVGRYLSPVISDYRERIRIGSRMISWQALGRLFEKIRQVSDQMQADGFAQPTSFEAETALAFLYFAEKKCDIVILECGMGGRTDATNIIDTPLLSVITSIGMDHSFFLGDTPEEIAMQKAGIIKAGGLAVCAPQSPGVLRVLEGAADQSGARLISCDQDEISDIRYGLTKQSFLFGKQRLTISLAGAYQIENAHLAAMAIRVLSKEAKPPTADKKLADRLKCNLTNEALRKGLAAVRWDGRFEIAAKNPLTILDGAHNRPAAKRLADSVKIYFPNRRIVYIMGVFRDKDTEGILEETAQLAEYIITFRLPDAKRSMDALTLAKKAALYCPRVSSADSLEEALELGRLLAGEDGVVIVFGSLSALGPARELIEKTTVKGRGTKK